MEACHEALQRLQTDYLDLYFVTDPTPMCPLKKWYDHAQSDTTGQGIILGTSQWSGAEL